MKHLIAYVALVAGIALAQPAPDIDWSTWVDPRTDIAAIVEKDGVLMRPVYTEHDPRDPRTWTLAGYEPVRWAINTPVRPGALPPVLPHAHECVPLNPTVPVEIGGVWVQNNIDNPIDGKNLYWSWYVTNTSYGALPSGSMPGAIGTTLIELHYLLHDGFTGYPLPAYAGEMLLGDEVWVFWSTSPSGNKAICTNSSQWLAIDNTEIFLVQHAPMNVTHPLAPAGTAYTTSSDFATPIADDPGLIGLAIYQQVWFRDVSEIGTNGEWPHAGHGVLWLLFDETP